MCPAFGTWNCSLSGQQPSSKLCPKTLTKVYNLLGRGAPPHPVESHGVQGGGAAPASKQKTKSRKYAERTRVEIDTPTRAESALAISSFPKGRISWKVSPKASTALGDIWTFPMEDWEASMGNPPMGRLGSIPALKQKHLILLN